MRHRETTVDEFYSFSSVFLRRCHHVFRLKITLRFANFVNLIATLVFMLKAIQKGRLTSAYPRTDKIATRISDFLIYNVYIDKISGKMETLKTLLLDLHEYVVLSATKEVLKEHLNVQHILCHTIDVRCNTFNVKNFAEHQCLQDFRFKKLYVGRISVMRDWNGIKGRNQYLCYPITAKYIFLQRLATTI